MSLNKLFAAGPYIFFALLALTVIIAFAGCTAGWKAERDAWKHVPANCAVEYDTRGAIVASYCAVR